MKNSWMKELCGVDMLHGARAWSTQRKGDTAITKLAPDSQKVLSLFKIPWASFVCSWKRILLFGQLELACQQLYPPPLVESGPCIVSHTQPLSFIVWPIFKLPKRHIPFWSKGTQAAKMSVYIGVWWLICHCTKMLLTFASLNNPLIIH